MQGKSRNLNILTLIVNVSYNGVMNEIQKRIAELEAKGWTLAAISDQIGNHWNTLAKWKAGDRYPANAPSVLLALDLLMKRKRIPKKKRYAPGSRQRKVKGDD